MKNTYATRRSPGANLTNGLGRRSPAATGSNRKDVTG